MEEKMEGAAETVKKIVEYLKEKGLQFQDPVSDNMGIRMLTDPSRQHGTHLSIRNFYNRIMIHFYPPDVEPKGPLWQAMTEAIEQETRSNFGLLKEGKFSLEEAADIASKVEEAFNFYNAMAKYALGVNGTNLQQKFTDFIKLAATYAKNFAAVSAATSGLEKTKNP